MQTESLLGWHFVGKTLRDGRQIPPDGEWLIHDGPIVPCKSGLHMSTDPFDALQYSPGSTLCRVELAGEIVADGEPVDKYVGRRRRIIKRIDATQLLRRFAADQALSVANLWDMPDIVRQYLETLDESLRHAARDAAWSTASESGWSRASEAACDSADPTAWDAAWNSAWSTVRHAAWSAARGVTEQQAWSEARDAAWSQAVDAAASDFRRRVDSAF